MEKKIRAGIIGLGNWGRYGHMPALRLLPDFEIVALASRRLELARELAAEWRVAHAFADAGELIAHPHVDLVVVLPPAPQHTGFARAAIAAGKDVYCEWPLTTSTADSEDLLARAEAAGVRHLVGLQRRLGPSARYVRDLLREGYVGALRSVRMHVSMNYFQARRSTDLAWTIPPENFSHILSIYGGHFMDLLFHIAGAPQNVSALVTPQFDKITLVETGESFPNRTPDEVVALGALAGSAVFTLQVEGGKRNNAGLQIDITGMAGDLKISNALPFGNREDNLVEGSQGDGEALAVLPVPASYFGLPPSELDASVLDLAYLYAAYARDRAQGTRTAPGFDDAVRMHRLIDAINAASLSGRRQELAPG
ncbi:MAG: Gfo/Idh/MocA family oxidoreductase [Verrucomicrobiota bacterium]